MTDLVVISLEVWDEVWRRNQHLIAGLLRSGAVRRVLFVEPAVDSLHEVHSGRWPGRAEIGLRRIAVDGSDGELWGYRPRKLLPRKVDPGGDLRRARKVQSVARRLGMEVPVLWVNDPGGAEVLKATRWPALYDITDDWLVADRSEAELARLHKQESELFARCDQVVVCSPALERNKSQQRPVTLVSNAVDLEPYRVLQPRPPDLPESPVALYLGTAHRDRIDVELCIETANRLDRSHMNKKPTVVLVGPAPLPSRDIEALRAAGVELLGPRPSPQVPAYLQHADVLLVPHVMTAFTASLDPIKAYEYRAARRKVVTTPVAGFVETDDPLVKLVTPTAFAEAVTSSLIRPTPWTSDLPADIPSWADRVAHMADVIGEVADFK